MATPPSSKLIQRIQKARQTAGYYGINDFHCRISEYHSDTHIISILPVENEKKCERELIKQSKTEFDFQNDIDN